MWPRPFWGESGHPNTTPVDHSIGHIPFTLLGGDKKPDKINQNPEYLNILCPKQENNVYISRVPPSDKNHLCICCGTRVFLNLFTHD